MWQEYINATSVNEVLQILADQGSKARIVAGGTDLILEIERGIRNGINTLIDVTRIPKLDRITLGDDQHIHLGPLVTHNHCVASNLVRERAFPLAQAAYEVGAPQIRNRGTIAGNLITASPANDTITPLMALGAKVKLQSRKGERVVPLDDFYTGVRKTVMRPDEMMVDISFPVMSDEQRGIFLKLGLRRAQAISIVDIAIVLSMEEKAGQIPRIKKADITLGAIAPTIVHAMEAEAFLVGRSLDDDTIKQAAMLALNASKPIDDVRGSAAYRREMVRVLIERGLHKLINGRSAVQFPSNPVLLWGNNFFKYDPQPSGSTFSNEQTRIVTNINGIEMIFHSGQDKTLLDLLREEAGLIGTKEGCAEGECGACTIFLDGMAVMGCLVPAPRAHGAEIITVEGLGKDDRLHPVQEAFIQEGAVQCGYCTPGFIMSAAMLLDEQAHPSRDEVQQAITGNLCRCTGYYKIVKAIEAAVDYDR